MGKKCPLWSSLMCSMSQLSAATSSLSFFSHYITISMSPSRGNTLDFIRSGKTVLPGKNWSLFFCLSFGGDHSCGGICFTLFYYHPPIGLGPLASSPLPPPPLWHQEALCRQPGEGI